MSSVLGPYPEAYTHVLLCCLYRSWYALDLFGSLVFTICPVSEASGYHPRSMWTFSNVGSDLVGTGCSSACHLDHAEISLLGRVWRLLAEAPGSFFERFRRDVRGGRRRCCQDPSFSRVCCLESIETLARRPYMKGCHILGIQGQGSQPTAK